MRGLLTEEILRAFEAELFGTEAAGEEMMTNAM